MLTLKAVSKKFCRDPGRAPRHALADMLCDALPFVQRSDGLRAGEAWALDAVSFTLRRGEALAVMGRNGAGKSSLLRIIAGLLAPDRGAFALDGTVNTVIELGQGLNPVLTGRENAVLGLAWRGVDAAAGHRALPDIVAFAELGVMFDAPVGTYSAGMRVRLAFAILAAVPADLLLLDEVLAVGDSAFRCKCIDHLRGHLDRGGALILVSHDPDQMRLICTRGLVLDHGRVICDGSLEEAIACTLSREPGADNPQPMNGRKIDHA